MERQHDAKPGLAAEPAAPQLAATPDRPRPLRTPQRKAGNQAVQGLLQTRLAVGQPGDEYEQEAEQVAERIASAPLSLQRHCACGGIAGPDGECAACRAKRLGLQRLAAVPAAPAEAPPIVHDVLRSSGQPLDSATRGFMEERLGYDFGDVRLHTGAQAAESARAVSALAYTVGQDVVFGAGQYRPEMTEGRRLMAHELAHVVQQTDGDLLAAPPAVLQRQQINNEAATGTADDGAATDSAYDEVATGTADTAKTGQPPPKGNYSEDFEKWTLSNTRPFIRDVLERYIVENGEDGARKFIARYAIDIGHAGGYDLSDIHGITPERQALSERLRPRYEILDLLRSEFTTVQQENTRFLKDFEKQAKDVIRGLLQASEDRINTERIRYGITEELIAHTRLVKNTKEGESYDVTTYETRYNMGGGAPVQEMAAAARLLVRLKNEIIGLDQQQQALVRMAKNTDEVLQVITDQAAYDRLGARINDKTRDYENLRADLESRYPLLAAFRDDTTALQQLGRGQSPETAALIGEQIREKLDKIDVVRRQLDTPKSVQVWKLPNIVDLTNEQMDVEPDTMHARVVKDKVSQVARDETIIGLLLGGLNLALVFAAPVTGGLTLIPAAGLSVGTALQRLREYELESAMAATDFDRARAISQEDPSLFWLALDIVGAVFDVGQAIGPAVRAATRVGARVFRTLAPLARRVRLARSAEEAEDIIRQAEQLARNQGEKGAELAKRVGESMRRAQRAGSLERAVAGESEEVRALERAAQTAAAEVSAADGVLASARAVGGEVKLTRSGRIFVCTSPCRELRDRFAVAFARNPKLEERLVDLERRSAEASDLARSTDATVRERGEQLAQTIKDEAAVLSNEARDFAHAAHVQQFISQSGLTDAGMEQLQAATDFFAGHEGAVGALLAEGEGSMLIKSGEHGGPWGGTHRGGFPRGKGYGFTQGGSSQGNIATHVEGHAAAIMWERGINRAVLIVDRTECSICLRDLASALPPDAELIVVSPGGSPTMYRSTHAR